MPEPMPEEVQEIAPVPAPASPEDDPDDALDDALAELSELAEQTMPETPAQENTSEAEDAAPKGPQRVSIANDHPEELQKATERPIVRDLLDLFGGHVADIHVKAQS